MKQNITLSVDTDLLTKLKVIATKRSTSLNRLLTDELKSIVERSERYEQAKRYALNALDDGFHLGGERISREDLHER